MTWVTSNVTFGSYNFPYGLRCDYRQADSRIDQADIPFSYGVNAPQGLTGVGTIHLTGMIGGYGAVNSSGVYITTRDLLEAEVQLMKSWLESGYQKLTLGFSDGRYCYAQKSKSKITYNEAEMGIIAHVDIELIAADPRWISPITQNSTVFNHGTAGHTLVSSGSALVYPTVTFTGPGKNPFFKIHPNSSSDSDPYVEIVLTYTLASGDTIIVNCDPNPTVRPSAVLLNGAPRLDLLGTTGSINTAGNQAFFPYMVPGNNRLNIDPDPGNGGASATGQLSWSDTFAL